MAIAIDEEHVAISDVLDRTLTKVNALAAERAALEAASEDGSAALPGFWTEFAASGWLGLHLPEDAGGAGAGTLEACLVMEAVGAHCAPGPFLPTMLSASVLARAAPAEPARALLPELANGTAVAATGLAGTLAFDPERPGELHGDAGYVLGAPQATWLLLRVDDDLVVVESARPGLQLDAIASMDPGLPVAHVRCDGVRFDESEVLRGATTFAVALGRTLAAAQAAGAAAAVTRMGTDYAKVREQFGRIIGSFQAVKHLCADMLIGAETATGAAWDAARLFDADSSETVTRQRDLAAADAASVSLAAFLQCAEINIQVHGGIGFTWEHDAHLYLRRAGVLASIFDRELAATDVWRLAAEGVERNTDVPLPDEAQTIRDEVRAFVAGLDGRPEDERREKLVESGYLMPEWPRPWGLGADTLAQYVIKQETRGLPKPVIDVPWVPMTIGQVGTPEQAERYLPGSLRGAIEWCQLSSEPDAGSDAAAVRTRATKVDGGWRLTGQKVWTSHAATASHGLATVRTNPDVAKHAGLSLIVVDMRAEGVSVRPLREIVGGARPTSTDFGDTSFNEVFFDEVFVPDEDVIGEVDAGWALVRQLLGNERVTIGERTSPVEASSLLALLAERRPDDAGYRRDVGYAVAEEHAVAALNLRRLIRSMTTAAPSAEANVVKIVNSERIQRIAALGMKILGDRGVDEQRDFGWLYLRSRFTTIGGGTSQINRNVLAERMLGLPRDK